MYKKLLQLSIAVVEYRIVLDCESEMIYIVIHRTSGAFFLLPHARDVYNDRCISLSTDGLLVSGFQQFWHYQGLQCLKGTSGMTKGGEQDERQQSLCYLDVLLPAKRVTKSSNLRLTSCFR
jgi:hypothetical protein